jgi:hypothetical protein
VKRTFPILLWVVGAMLLAHVNALAAKPFRASPGDSDGVRDYLNPDTGRFWTMDSYEGDNQDPNSLHKYLYCHGDAVNYKDPTGLSDAGTMPGILGGSV